MGRARALNSTPNRTPKPGNKVDTILSTIDVAQKIYGMGKDAYNKYIAYNVVVREDDAIYSDVHNWLIDVLPEEKHRSISIISSKRSNYDDGPDEVSDSSSRGGFVPPPLKIQYNERTRRKIMIENHPVMIQLHIPEVNEKTSVMRLEYAKIIFTARSHAGQKAIVRQLRKLNDDRATVRKAVLKMLGQWGNWTTRSDLPPRTLESVVLPQDQKDRIVADLRDFLGAEDHYNRLAIPWHRGYMFHGPPGTGKTSVVKALANEFNLDLWYVSLADLKTETSLMGLLSSVTPRSLLLLEDIDTMRITHDRDGAEQGTISMSSLLNVLDGVATPHGLITIMTTNRFDILDEALTRAGRMDLVEKLDYPSLNTISTLYEHFYGKEPNWIVAGMHPDQWDKPIKGLSTSQIAEIMKRHLNDPDAAADAIAKMHDEYLEKNKNDGSEESS